MRLFFLGIEDWQTLDRKISPGKIEFISMIDNCFKKWRQIQKTGNKCILIVGDIACDKTKKMNIPDTICHISNLHGYKIDSIIDYPISKDRKVEKKESQIHTEKICVLEKI